MKPLRPTKRSAPAALPRAWPALCALAAGCWVLLPAHALYKVIDANGNVTYTDKPPASPGAVTQSVDVSGGAAPTATMPAELRKAITTYPVTLYTTKDCKPCDAGRDFLRQRGVPYSEKLVQTAADTKALKALTGDLGLPVLSVGGKQLKAYNAAEWQTHLDAAGYPAQNKLPADYAQPQPQPLTPPVAAPAAPAVKPPARPAPAAEPPPEQASGIRF